MISPEIGPLGSDRASDTTGTQHDQYCGGLIEAPSMKGENFDYMISDVY